MRKESVKAFLKVPFRHSPGETKGKPGKPSWGWSVAEFEPAYPPNADSKFATLPPGLRGPGDFAENYCIWVLGVRISSCGFELNVCDESFNRQCHTVYHLLPSLQYLCCLSAVEILQSKMFWAPTKHVDIAILFSLKESSVDTKRARNLLGQGRVNTMSAVGAANQTSFLSLQLCVA